MFPGPSLVQEFGIDTERNQDFVWIGSLSHSATAGDEFGGYNSEMTEIWGT